MQEAVHRHCEERSNPGLHNVLRDEEIASFLAMTAVGIIFSRIHFILHKNPLVAAYCSFSFFSCNCLTVLVPKLDFGTQLLLKLNFATPNPFILHLGAIRQGREIQFRGQVRSKIQFWNEPS